MTDITKEEIQSLIDASSRKTVEQIAEIFGEYAKQNDERFDSIDERFDAIDERFDAIDERFDAVDSRINVLEHRFDRLEGRMDQLESDVREGFDRVNTTLDGIASRLDIDDTERVAASVQVDRHEDWIEEAAPIVGVPYSTGA